MKTCNYCAVEKEMTEFRLNGEYYDNTCKKCTYEKDKEYHKEKSKERWNDKKEAVSTKQKEYRENNADKMLRKSVMHTLRRKLNVDSEYLLARPELIEAQIQAVLIKRQSKV